MWCGKCRKRPRLVFLELVHQGSQALTAVKIGEALLFRGRGQHFDQRGVFQTLTVRNPDLAVGELHVADKTGHFLNVDWFPAAGEAQFGIL